MPAAVRQFSVPSLKPLPSQYRPVESRRTETSTRSSTAPPESDAEPAGLFHPALPYVAPALGDEKDDEGAVESST